MNQMTFKNLLFSYHSGNFQHTQTCFHSGVSLVTLPRSTENAPPCKQASLILESTHPLSLARLSSNPGMRAVNRNHCHQLDVSKLLIVNAVPQYLSSPCLLRFVRVGQVLVFRKGTSARPIPQPRALWRSGPARFPHHSRLHRSVAVACIFPAPAVFTPTPSCPQLLGSKLSAYMRSSTSHLYRNQACPLKLSQPH